MHLHSSFGHCFFSSLSSHISSTASFLVQYVSLSHLSSLIFPSSSLFPPHNAPFPLSSSSVFLFSALFTSFTALPPPVSGHFSCVSSTGCHTWAACLSLCWRSMSLEFNIFSLFILSFVFIFFTDAGHLTVWSHFQISATQTLIHYSFVLFPLAGCHRLREEEICFHHMLICSELPVEADRYLFPRSHRESDGDCFYVFISSTPSDELSHPHIENFCSGMVHKKLKKKKKIGSAAKEEIHFQDKVGCC